jgi:hypothetical protein
MERIGCILGLLGVQSHVPWIVSAAWRQGAMEDQGPQQKSFLHLSRLARQELDLRPAFAP